jgi:hypothetical protein
MFAAQGDELGQDEWHLNFDKSLRGKVLST